MFFMKFKILTLKPTCTLGGYIIMYTGSLTIITPREVSRKATNGHVVTMNVNKHQASQLTLTQVVREK